MPKIIKQSQMFIRKLKVAMKKMKKKSFIGVSNEETITSLSERRYLSCQHHKCRKES